MVAALLKSPSVNPSDPLSVAERLIESTDVAQWKNPSNEWLGEPYPFAKDYCISVDGSELSIGLELSTELDAQTGKPKGYVPTLRTGDTFLQGPEVDLLYIRLNEKAKAKWAALEGKVEAFADQLPDKFEFDVSGRLKPIPAGGLVDMPDSKGRIVTAEDAGKITAFRGLVAGYEFQLGRFTKYEPIGGGLMRDVYTLNVTVREGPYSVTAVRSGDRIEALFGQITPGQISAASGEAGGFLFRPKVPAF